MRYIRRQPTGRGRLSLRSRLLAGLITITALFLIVMGVVTTVVLGNIEQNQFNTDLGLPSRRAERDREPGEGLRGGLHQRSRPGRPGSCPAPSPTATDLQKPLNNLIATRQATAYFRAVSAPGTLFPHLPAGRAGPDRDLAEDLRRARQQEQPAAARREHPAGGAPGQRGGQSGRVLVLAELITGAILLALLGLGGRWLISRGLAPLDRMASTADMITSRGDLTARMPDPGDHAEAGRLAAAINTMLDRIQQAFGARWASEQKVRQFAADASHELRTPLTTIRGYAELYRQGALGPDRLPNAMRRIEQEADRMSSLVAELLELARLDRNSSLDLTDTDMAELVRDAVADAKAVEPARPVSATAPPRLIVVADEPRIRQVLANLLGNVREHTAPETPVAVRLAQAGQGALLEVTDAGQGMSEEAAARAFDRFYRGGHNGNGHGSGLGLSIVQAIATAHGGHAMLKSAAGAGTSVQFWIPFRPPGQPGADADDPSVGPARTPHTTEPSVASASPATQGRSGARSQPGAIYPLTVFCPFLRYLVMSFRLAAMRRQTTVRPMQDRELVAAIVIGDPDGLAEAYDRYAAPLYTYCRFMLPDPHPPGESADAVADTFIIAAAKLQGLRDPGQLGSWLHAVARNECLRQLGAGAGLAAGAALARPAGSARWRRSVRPAACASGC